MGDFRIVIDGVGGHGQDRAKKDGEVVDFTKTGDFYNSDITPENLAQILVKILKGIGVNIDSAKFIHWPADNYGGPEQNGRIAGEEVVDDLLTGVRKGSF